MIIVLIGTGCEKVEQDNSDLIQDQQKEIEKLNIQVDELKNTQSTDKKSVEIIKNDSKLTTNQINNIDSTLTKQLSSSNKEETKVENNKQEIITTINSQYKIAFLKELESIIDSNENLYNYNEIIYDFVKNKAPQSLENYKKVIYALQNSYPELAQKHLEILDNLKKHINTQYEAPLYELKELTTKKSKEYNELYETIKDDNPKEKEWYYNASNGLKEYRNFLLRIRDGVEKIFNLTNKDIKAQEKLIEDTTNIIGEQINNMPDTTFKYSVPVFSVVQCFTGGIQENNFSTTNCSAVSF